MNKGDKIPAEEWLYRRAFRKDKKYVHPRTHRPTSRAFAPRPKDEGKLSVDISSLTTEEEAIMDKVRFALFKIQAATAYQQNLSCLYDPLTSEEDGFDNPAHALITGFAPDDETVPGLLARAAEFVQ